MADRLGILYLVSGPSGSGKTTLCRRLAETGEVHYSTSCTTRKPREGEVQGHDYHFLSQENFTKKVANKEFLEHAEVHGNSYGTLKNEVIAHIQAGRDIVMDIDVQGAALVRENLDPLIQKSLVDLFIMLDEDELENRLAHRGTDSDEVIDLRLKNARSEMEQCSKYRFHMYSHTREEDFDRFRSLLVGQRMKTERIS